MAKISEIFSLNKTQFELDFVDVDINKDFPVYLNPFVFSSREDVFSMDAIRVVKSFFQYNLDLIQSGNIEEARKNFNFLNEPKETCLGMSKGKPRGKGMGRDNSEEVFESILNSGAVQSGIVDDLEDAAIFIDGIGKDKVSDMTTNIIRKNLIIYTQNQCKLHNIPMRVDTASGMYWDISTQAWKQEFTEMLVIEDRKILLVPKGVVSYVEEFNHDKYHQHYALNFLQDDHLSKNTRLVKYRYDKKGKVKDRFVTKKSIIESELPKEKNTLVTFTNKHPQVFKKFKEEIAQKVRSLDNQEFGDFNIEEIIDYLISELKNTNSGGNDASKYHRIMIGVLELLFYPHLINPIKELEINEGRKRIDISFDNAALGNGFFHRLDYSFNIPCQYIFVECKNYSSDIENPELDQMVGRLSPRRGKFGIILCRELQNMDLFIQRCKDSYQADHGLIIPLVDSDIIEMLNKYKANIDYTDELLSNRARLIMNM